jgi:hypothetical protein
MRTKEEKDEMIKCLESQKEKAPVMTFFGDNNHDAIDAQIEVIENDYDDDEVYKNWESNDNTLSAALVVVEWLNGNDSAGEELRTQWD